MEDRKTETIRKVPLLGDIPWVGAAFRRSEKNKAKTELLIFLTPHVVSRPEVLQGMAQEEMDKTQLTPSAVGPGEFQRHLDSMEAGGRAATQPAPSAEQPQRPLLAPSPATRPGGGR
jgi:type II secretory pathway component GspD/PulD (secretin)